MDWFSVRKPECDLIRAVPGMTKKNSDRSSQLMLEGKPLRTVKTIALYYVVLLGYLATTGMHIPDGYLSPVICAIFFLLVFPFWSIGIRRLRETLSARNVPLIALMAAFSFVVMMFNVPLPGGTTGHAVGATLAAILLGPEVACIAVSIALMIQAIFFGDGGILAAGANCFNMAVIVPYTGYAIYRLFSRNQPANSSRRLIGSFLGGWAGVTLAAFFAGIEFGIQPLLFTSAAGTPLYAPYPLSIAVPAMVLPHALVASVVEGLITALVLSYLMHSDPAILEQPESAALLSKPGAFGKLRWLWIGLLVLVIASPIGLLAPGTAWGEWKTEELGRMGLGFIPQGMAGLSSLWGAPMAGYHFFSLGNANLGYLLSALVGVLVTCAGVWLMASMLTRRLNQETVKPDPHPAGAGQSHRSHSRVIERTLLSVSETAERLLFAEEISGKPGFLQSLDPRVKLVTTLALIVSVGLSHQLWILAGLYLLALVLAWRSAIPLGFFIKRVWLLLPFFTGLIVFPALFVTPGPPLIQLPMGLMVTQTGAQTVLFLLLRVGASLSFSLLLILTTPWNTVLAALHVLHIPDEIILVLGMTYRYIFLLLRSVADMFLSRQSRVVGRLSSAEERKIIAASVGTLLNRSLDLSGQVYLAMVSRGFRGKIRTLKPFKMKPRDWAWGSGLLVITLLAVILGR